MTDSESHTDPREELRERIAYELASRIYYRDAWDSASEHERRLIAKLPIYVEGADALLADAS